MRDLLTLSQWMSPAFPVGAFAFSHGVETAIRNGAVCDAYSLENWLWDVLEYGSGWADAVLLVAAFRAESLAALAEVEARGAAFQPAAERLEEARQLGAAFARTVSAVWNLDVPHHLYSVAVGQAARLNGLDLEQTIALYLHGFAANQVSAAVRLVPLGQTDGQMVLAALTTTCERLARAAVESDLDDLCSAAFLSDIAAMRHETLSPRIFQS